MSYQWSLIAGFLYMEIALVVIILIPLLSPRRWRLIFKSRFITDIRRDATIYYYALLGILVIFMVDAYREMRKYSNPSETFEDLASAMNWNLKMFRAQRNCYIIGFTLFLSYVLRRLLQLLIVQNELSYKAEQILKSAEATVTLAKDTVIKNTVKANDMLTLLDVLKQVEDVVKALEEEKVRTKELKKDLIKWKLKCARLEGEIHGEGDE